MKPPSVQANIGILSLQDGRKKQELCIRPERSVQTVEPASREMLLQLCFLVLLSEPSDVFSKFSPRDEDISAKWLCCCEPPFVHL